MEKIRREKTGKTDQTTNAEIKQRIEIYNYVNKNKNWRAKLTATIEEITKEINQSVTTAPFSGKEEDEICKILNIPTIVKPTWLSLPITTLETIDEEVYKPIGAKELKKEMKKKKFYARFNPLIN